jgi:hypothetical protein
MAGIQKDEFFIFYHQRLFNLKQIENLEPHMKTHQWASFNPELNILLSAELDALAKYWAMQANFKCRTSEERFGEFLARNAGPAWSKCSYLNLVRRAKNEAIQQEAELNQVLWERLPPLAKTPADFPWMYDLDLDSLLQDADIAASGIPAKWLYRSRYGEILYRHYRCGWIHALNPDPELHTDYHHIYDCEHPPQYLTRNGSRVFAIPTEFILSSFENVLNLFEAATPHDTQFEVR